MCTISRKCLGISILPFGHAIRAQVWRLAWTSNCIQFWFSEKLEPLSLLLKSKRPFAIKYNHDFPLAPGIALPTTSWLVTQRKSSWLVTQRKKWRAQSLRPWSVSAGLFRLILLDPSVHQELFKSTPKNQIFDNNLCFRLNQSFKKVYKK